MYKIYKLLPKIPNFNFHDILIILFFISVSHRSLLFLIRNLSISLRKLAILYIYEKIDSKNVVIKKSIIKIKIK